MLLKYKLAIFFSGLLNAVLTLIFMSGGVIKDDQLVAFLSKMGLHVSKNFYFELIFIVILSPSTEVPPVRNGAL